MLSTRIEEAILASCKSGTAGCSGREEEERGVERDRELDLGVDANRRLFTGGTPSPKVGMGEDAKDWEREEVEGVREGFVNFGGGFEVEALAFIARVEQAATCRSHIRRVLAISFRVFASLRLRVFVSLTLPMQYTLFFYSMFFLSSAIV